MAKAKKKKAPARRARPASRRAKDLASGSKRNPRGGASLSAGASSFSDSAASLAEINQANQLTLQQAVDTSTKTSAMLSNVLKKSADTSSSIAGNLK